MTKPSVILQYCIPLLIIGAVAADDTALTEAGGKLEAIYTEQLEQVRTEISSVIPRQRPSKSPNPELLTANDKLDDQLIKHTILHQATPRGLAIYAQQGRQQAGLINQLLSNTALMKQMLIADGAAKPKQGRNGFGPAQYGKAIEIYTDIQKASTKASGGVLQRLAVATSLAHAVPIEQANPEADSGSSKIIDPVNRYLHYETAYLNGELDPTFKHLSTWELRMVVNGDEPDVTLAWGREMLRNLRPDHVRNPNFGWRYVNIVSTDVKYGSQNVKDDRPELQKYQNMLMNGGVCGRRAFFGRFILRSFGVPTIARPSRGHAALAHWTPNGWVVNLGPGWGKGYTKTFYGTDKNFLASTQARVNADDYIKVKRAQWIGDVFGETRSYGQDEKTPPGYWNSISLRHQQNIIKASKAVTHAALGEELGESNKQTAAQKSTSATVTEADKKVAYSNDGSITIPAAGYSKPTRNSRDIQVMKSFDSGLQIFLPRFFPKGLTVLRGGTWKGEPNKCTSGTRMLSGGYGRYENWGFRVAITAPDNNPAAEISIKLGNDVTMELIYIKPGSFVMGGESTSDGRFHCVEVPKHEVQLTKGYYIGKYEVTQAQYMAIITGKNPSKSTKAPNCPVDNISETEALSFCSAASRKAGLEVRLPTEAEWEYACRAGSDSQWFFGDNAAQLEDYGWVKSNAAGKSHPVGLKKPNSFGLFDVYGNVNERVADKYDRQYYAKSPKIDPTGPSPGTQSNLEYTVSVPSSGKYQLAATVVTSNYQQRICVAINDSDKELVKQLPFTEGRWQTSTPIIVDLKKGDNTIKLWRNEPPQYGIAVKNLRITPTN